MMAGTPTSLPSISLTPDLVIFELEFLRNIDQQGGSFYDPRFIRNAVRRYHDFWVPLVAHFAGPDGCLLDYDLAPPLDVHWTWHVHMLSPISYREDLEGSPLKRPILHRPEDWNSLAAKRAKTAETWSRLFGSQEPFWPPDSGGGDEAVLEEFEARNSFSYNILDACLRQKSFYYQVSLSHFRSPDFINESILRYRQFLYLKSRHPDTFLVPCYDMDIVWHTHQVSVQEYLEDCCRILGKLLPHDDSVNDRSPGSTLLSAEAISVDLWKETFGQSFAKPGCMYRGDPPQGKLTTITREDQMSVIMTDIFDLEMAQFSWQVDDVGSVKQKTIGLITGQGIQIFVRALLKRQTVPMVWENLHFCNRRPLPLGSCQLIRSHQNGDPSPLKVLTYKSEDKSACITKEIMEAECSRDVKPTVIIIVPDLCFEDDMKLDFEVYSKQICPGSQDSSFKKNVKGAMRSTKGFFKSLLSPWSSGPSGSNSTKTLAESRWLLDIKKDFMPLLSMEAGPKNRPEACSRQAKLVSREMDGKCRSTLTLECCFVPKGRRPGWKPLYIQPGTFYDCVMPEDVEAMWGPIPLGSLPPGVEENNCKAITHSIVDQGERKVLTVYLIHSLPLKMSAIQVFLRDKMVCVAHLVDEATLGREQSLGLREEFKNCAWRAMIIKDNEGDWGLCAASWKGLVPGVPGKPGRPGRPGVKGIPGNPGHFKMNFVNLRTGAKDSVVLPEGGGGWDQQVRKYTFRSKSGLFVDLEKGTLILGPDDPSPIQSVTYAFTTSLLYLMVQPRPWNHISTSNPTRTTTDDTFRPLYLDAPSLLFLSFVGWGVSSHVSTNSTLQHFGMASAGAFMMADTCHVPDAASGDWGECGGCGGCGGCGTGGIGGGLFGGDAIGGDSGVGGNFGDFGGDFGGGGDGGGAAGCGGCGGCGG